MEQNLSVGIPAVAATLGSLGRCWSAPALSLMAFTRLSLPSLPERCFEGTPLMRIADGSQIFFNWIFARPGNHQHLCIHAETHSTTTSAEGPTS